MFLDYSRVPLKVMVMTDNTVDLMRYATHTKNCACATVYAALAATSFVHPFMQNTYNGPLFIVKKSFDKGGRPGRSSFIAKPTESFTLKHGPSVCGMISSTPGGKGITMRL